MYVDPIITQIPENIDKEKYVVATYYVANKRDMEALKYAAALAVEQTTGTWTPVPAETTEIREKFIGRIIGVYEVPAYSHEIPEEVKERHFILRVAFPTTNFGPQFSMQLTTLIGNISSEGKLKLIDIEYPETYLKEFKGPKFGVSGIRKLLGVKDRPLLNNMIKPCIGLDPKATAKLAYEAAIGGVDIIKDDELTADPPHCRLVERVKEVMKALKAADEEKGEKTLYTFNITDRTEKLKENALRAIDAGANALMVNVWPTGLDACRMLTDDAEINVPILAHCDMMGALYESPWSGLSANLVCAKYPRLAGMDMGIILSPYGKFPLTMDTFIQAAYTCLLPIKHIKSMFPMPGGGTTQGHIEELMKKFGNDIIIAAGGAIHGHPMGATAGVKAFRQGIDAVMSKISLKEAIKDSKNKELKAAIDAWGIYGEKNIYDLVVK